MINIEKNVEAALYKSAYQGLKIYFEPLKGKPFHITSLDIVEGSFQIKKTSTSTNNMQIGNMSADDLSMELMNPTDSWGIGKFDDVYFCGATMRLYLLVYDQTQDIMTETPFGVYIIDNQPRALDTIKITAFSNVIRLDIPFKASELPTVMKLYDLVDTGLEKARLDHDDSIEVFPNNAYGLLDTTKIKSEQTITWRQVIKWCCECAGVNAISDEDGVIKFVFYDKYTPDVLRDEDNLNLETEDGEILLIDDTPTADFPLTPALRYADNSSEVAEEDVVITGFQFKVDDVIYPKLKTETEQETETEAERVMDDYILQSENNLVFYALARESFRDNVAKTVNEKLAGFTYRPFKCNMLSFPHLQTCDSVVYIKDGKQYHSIITDIVYKLNGDMTLTAKGKNKEQKAFEVLGALTPKQQAIIDSVSRKVDTTREQLSSYENALLLFNEKMLHSMGLHKTVKDDPNGGIITYFHNMETLENSDTIYMFGASGFAWTTTGWNNGDPIWHYGFTDTGDAILNTIHAYKLSAELIETGYLRSQNGASWISLDDGTFCFRSAIPLGMDLDTGEAIYSYEKVLELANKQLNVYGTLRSLQYPSYSVSIGESEKGSFGALTATYNEPGYGDIFQVYPTYWYNVSDPNSVTDRGATITAPFVGSGDGNRKGVQFNSNESILWNEKNLGSALLYGSDAWVSVFRDNINLSTSASHRHCWFNYFQPKHGYSPIAYDFGDGAGGHADIICADVQCGEVTSTGEVKCTSVNSSGYGIFQGALVCGGTDGYQGYVFTANGNLGVDGKAYADSFNVWSERSKKENIVEQANVNALQKLRNLSFYSYDFKKSNEEGKTETKLVHVPFGTIVDEAPEEIQTEDGKGIELYSYIGLTAKGVQELNEKFEAQEKRIKILEEKIGTLEKVIANLV